jgi:hypothetical protein
LGRQLESAGSHGAVVLRYRLEAEGKAKARLRRLYDKETREEVLEVADCLEGQVNLRPQSQLTGLYWLDSGDLGTGVFK